MTVALSSLPPQASDCSVVRSKHLLMKCALCRCSSSTHRSVCSGWWSPHVATYENCTWVELFYEIVKSHFFSFFFLYLCSINFDCPIKVFRTVALLALWNGQSETLSLFAAHLQKRRHFWNTYHFFTSTTNKHSRVKKEDLPMQGQNTHNHGGNMVEGGVLFMQHFQSLWPLSSDIQNLPKGPVWTR